MMESLVPQSETWGGCPEREELTGKPELDSEQQSSSSEEASERRKTWNELRGVVSDLRRRMSGMSAGSVPGSITFRSLPDGR